MASLPNLDISNQKLQNCLIQAWLLGMSTALQAYPSHQIVYNYLILGFTMSGFCTLNIASTDLTMTVLMTPDMANFSGNVHGGTILKLL